VTDSFGESATHEPEDRFTQALKVLLSQRPAHERRLAFETALRDVLQLSQPGGE
jgi:hypothetical protein